MNRKWRGFRLGFISFLTALILTAFAPPSYAHWADLAVAEIAIAASETNITLTFPTALVASSDDNRNGQLDPQEVRNHQAELQTFLGDRIRLSDRNNNKGILTVNSSENAVLPPNIKAQAGTHTTLLLNYTWSKPVQGLKIYYDLFLPGVPTARCLATIINGKKVQNSIFSPENREISLTQGQLLLPEGSSIVVVAATLFWGAMHALSPGHGKTIVGAYLVGSRATIKHALFLGLTTTITHTTGVFLLGLATLFASQFFVPEQLTPWISFLSGLIVVIIGLNLFVNRWPLLLQLIKSRFGHKHSKHDHAHHDHHDHSHDHHDHSHDRDHAHHDHHDHNHDHAHDHHDHSHDRGHSHHNHSHLPPGADGSPVTWRSLLALGIAGGILPCPSALVLLLSAIALNNTAFGLLLVFVFSFGLAGTLTTIGLLMVGARQLFERLPLQIRLIRGLSALSALFITLLGLGITTQALLQIRAIGL